MNGNLILDGTLTVVASGGPSASPADGAYRLFDYTGTLTDNGLTISGAPSYSLYTINTAISHQVDLIVIAGQWWNGTTTTSGGSSVQGGDGTWDVAGGATNWTNQAGATAHAWTQGGIAVFGGAAGTVTIGGATAPDLVGRILRHRRLRGHGRGAHRERVCSWRGASVLGRERDDRNDRVVDRRHGWS